MHCPFQGLPCVDVKIKWPNDLYLNGLKVGGILCTSTYKSKKFNVSAGNGLVLWLHMNVLQQAMLLYTELDELFSFKAKILSYKMCVHDLYIKSFHVLAGIGLNIDNEKPTTCLNAVLRELSVVVYQFSREEILAAIFEKFEKFYDIFINQGKYMF